jgi:hypothetical protein
VIILEVFSLQFEITGNCVNVFDYLAFFAPTSQSLSRDDIVFVKKWDIGAELRELTLNSMERK